MSSFTTARFPTLSWARGQRAETAGVEPTPAPTDEQLLKRIPNGDQEALALLFQRYSQVAYNIGSRILRNSTEAEDLAQDLFLFIQRKCAIFDSTKSTARSWIIQMTYHRAFERRRYLTARRFYSRAEIESNAGQVVGTPTRECDYSADAVFGRNGLAKVLQSLSEDQRDTLRLHFFDGYTFAEISQRRGESLENVRHHYYRGLDKLRRQMFGNNVPLSQRNGK